MLFNSYEFLILLLITLLVYYRAYGLQVPLLILSSFSFYAFNTPKLLLLLLVSVILNIIFSYAVVHSEYRKKSYAIAGVVTNLLILIFFKYSPLLGSTFFPSTSSLGHFLTQIPLPIGISFFTFQGISLLVDTFKDSQKVNYTALVPKLISKHGLNTALFISFFPQLVAGPIVKAKDFIPQISKKYFKDIDFTTCFKNLTTGYFLKMVVADNLHDFTGQMIYPYFIVKPSIELLIMLFGYSMQIFADFAGYSLIAIGIAGLFGYRLHDNFLFPYISKSFSEFWRRWHISLSSFLKEYLYFPLGGNRKGKGRTYINLFITMALGGLWHGAAWSYAIWGFYHGMALAIERYLKDQFGTSENKWLQIGKGIFVFSIVTLGWLLFRLPEFDHVIGYVSSVFSNFSQALALKDIRNIGMILIYSIPVLTYHLYYIIKVKNSKFRFVKYEFAAYGLMLFFIFTNSGSADAFIYFQF